MTEKWITLGLLSGLVLACLCLFVAGVVALCNRQWVKVGIRFGIAATLVVLAGAILPMLPTNRPVGHRSRCMSNLSQIGKACYMYAMDHDKRFPPSLLALTNYAGNAKLFICPHSRHKEGTIATVDVWSDYALVTNLSKESSPIFVLAYCKPDNHREGKPTYKGINVLFVDGSVSWVQESDYGTLTCDVLKGSRINNKEPQHPPAN